MSRQHPYSLTLRLALIFALLAFALLATLGVALYRELERELIRARQSGVAHDNEELEMGVRCMAAGIYDDQDKLVAGLSISAPADRLEDDWLPKLQHTAQEISAALGHTGSLARG